MKKLTLFAVATAVLVIALASVAYAGTSSGYVPWSSVGANAGSLPTPHKDFQLTTNKCEVCHAVHKGDANGQALLRGNVADACTFCHIDNQIGNIRIYNGIAANYSGSGIAVGHNRGGAPCVNCHAVHGANTMTGTVSAKILKYGSFQTSASLALSGWDATSGARDDQVSIFCTKCHPYFTRDYNGDINVTGGTDPGTYASHVMTSSGGDLTTYGNPTANYAGQVAWAASNHCRDCHDAGNINESQTSYGIVSAQNFPHYTQNSSRLLLGAMYSGASTATLIGSAESSAQADGVCLKCHRGSAATGVGFDY